jgi:FixJ family two-component response regulator
MSGRGHALLEADAQGRALRLKALAERDAAILRRVKAGECAGAIAKALHTTSKLVRRVVARNGVTLVSWKQWIREGGNL